ncbi:class I SAM-dependent methyltransferase [Pseudokineococcus marinus]|uniref:Class I SAM-dependent methyltransferase n=1 Tax=Pseudokineococcus marinus TaxID=351215 RepID=A0A849BLE6_9ACTN|nr:class I SAM-dependent methyltransferase [Pseudokineococcus marinus]NNH24089.1 class I SAM-dependent methyltransferase [Pseudokineococcus marinus]
MTDAAPGRPAAPDAGDPADAGGEGAFSSATGRTLEEGSGAGQPNYKAYQLELMRPHVGRTLLEVGAGLGELAETFARGMDLERHVVTDVDPGAVAQIARRFADRPEVEARRLDLDGELPDLGAPVATVLASNVLEHIEDDAGALRRLARLVEPGGTVVMFVPAYMQLYGDFDRRVGHVRRYTPATLRSAFERAGLAPRLVRPVNLLGGLAWWAAVRRGGVGTPKPGLVRVYDGVVVPVTRMLEKVVTPPFGQSVLGVAEVLPEAADR